MKRLLTLVALAAALTASAQVKVVKLWDNASAPHSNEDAGPQKEKNGNLYNTVDTELFIYPAAPDKATGQAVVICPGGGYISLAYGHEGLDVAEWMNEHGITAVVLRYRMPNGHPEIPLKDAQTALKLVRQKAADWHVDPNRVGIMGFSAGGHLAATAATHFTGPEDRPDFSILIYPVISMDSITHQGSKDNLLGTNAPAELAERYSTHGGSDFYATHFFIEKILGREEGLKYSIDVYTAVDMGICGILAYRSVLNGGAPMDIPNLRNPAERDAWRSDNACTNPAVAGNQLLPCYPGGDKTYPDAVYENVRRMWLAEKKD